MIGVLWKAYLAEKSSKEKLILEFFEKRQSDSDKNIELLFKVQHGYENLVRMTNKIDGMITLSEKQELLRIGHDIKKEIAEIAKTVSNGQSKTS